MMQSSRLDSNRGSEESPRRLVTRACDACGKKKIRCESIQPISNVCAQCIKSKTSCHFTPVSVLKSRRRLSRDKRVEELEKKLAGIQDQLQLPVEERQSSTSSSSPEVQDIASQQILVSNTPSLNFSLPTSSIIREPPVFQPLPSKEKALHLITTYFSGVNAVIPIFNQDTFLLKFDTSYTPYLRHTDPSWWAALNVVLALAHQYWDALTPSPQDEAEAWGYFQNAFAATNQLMARHYTLTSVQALLGMAMLMTAMPHQRPVTALTGSAIMIAHDLGLHREDHGLVYDDAEREERRRVFWVAYALDKDVSLQLRQPPSQDDEDMDVKLPAESDYGLVKGGAYHPSLFYFRTRLAVIQGQVYRRLLSVKASKQSAVDKSMAVEELETALQSWRRSVPIELFRDYAGPLWDGTLETFRHSLYLQLAYLKTLAVVHECQPIFPWHNEIESTDVRVHIWSTPVTYPVEARSAMKLFSVTPRRKLACVWTALHIFITAATTLLIHTVSNPSHAFVQMDLKLLEPFLHVLGYMAKNSVEEGDRVEGMYKSSMLLFEQARMAVGRSGIGSKQYQRIEGNDYRARESVEDFLERMERISSGDSTDVSLISSDGWQ